MFVWMNTWMSSFFFPYPLICGLGEDSTLVIRLLKTPVCWKTSLFWSIEEIESDNYFVPFPLPSHRDSLEKDAENIFNYIYCRNLIF